MSTELRTPQTIQLPPMRFAQRREHLLREISPTPSASWSRRIRMPVLVLAGAAAVLGVAAAAVAIGGSAPKLDTASLSAGERLKLSHVSAVGSAVTLPAGDIRTKRLKDSGYRAVTLLTSRGGQSFYRIETVSGIACFGTGRTGAAWPFAVIGCRSGGAAFPSAGAPLLDESTVASSSPNDPLVFTDLKGFAADGVTAVEGVNARGAVAVSVTVSDNVYFLDSSQTPGDIVSIQAVDAAGHIIASSPR